MTARVKISQIYGNVYLMHLKLVKPNSLQVKIYCFWLVKALSFNVHGSKNASQNQSTTAPMCNHRERTTESFLCGATVSWPILTIQIDHLVLQYQTDIQILVIWLVELTSSDIHYYSHPHRRSKSHFRPWGIVFPIQQLGSSLFPMFLSSRVPLLKQRSTCAKGCDPIDINLCDY